MGAAARGRPHQPAKRCRAVESTVLTGKMDPRFAPVRDALTEVLGNQTGTGAAVAAWYDGAWVVDLWGGWADAARTRPWQEDSIVQPYSVCKPFAALCVLQLVERGQIDLDAPMQRYWPDFLAPATVRHVLSHQAGVVAIDEPAPTEVFYDWDRMCSLLAEQEPAWPPGTAHGESALFYGHLVGELVRRVDGRSLGRFLHDEICRPACPWTSRSASPAADHDRAVELTGLDEAFRQANASTRPELYRRAVENPPGAQSAEVVNGRAWRTAEIPAVNGHGSARGIAGLYAALLEASSSHRACSPRQRAHSARVAIRSSGTTTPGGWGSASTRTGSGWAGSAVATRGASIARRLCVRVRHRHDGRRVGRAQAVENAFRSCAGLPDLDSA